MRLALQKLRCGETVGISSETNVSFYVCALNFSKPFTTFTLGLCFLGTLQLAIVDSCLPPLHDCL
jgi:hypothetical protein